MSISARIKERLVALGFDGVGISRAGSVDGSDERRLGEFVESGRCGSMGYLGRHFEKRIDIRELLPGCRSVISVLLCYKPAGRVSGGGVEGEANGCDGVKDAGWVAPYARYSDYHQFIKERLYAGAEYLKEAVGIEGDFRFKVCVDSAPVLERYWAARSGLGFIGANHMFISYEFGVRVFLGEILTNVELEADEAKGSEREVFDFSSAEHPCSGCGLCVEACPGGALKSDGGFDARSCNSYLSIEHKGGIDFERRWQLGGRLFGCDECIGCCPYDAAGAVKANDDLVEVLGELIEPGEVLGMSEADFEERFSGTAIYRLGLGGLKRNARICIENSG